MLCLFSKSYCCYDRKINKYKFNSKGLNKGTLEDCEDGPMSKYRKVLEQAAKVISTTVISTNIGFRTMKHPTNRQKRDCLISTQNVLEKQMEYILNL